MKNNKSNILVTACAVGFMSNGGVILSPALPSIIAFFSGMPEIFTQMIVTIPAVMMIPSSVIASLLTRKYSIKRIFKVCLFILLLSGVLPYIFQNFPVILFSRIMVGVAIGSMNPIATALIANTFQGVEKERAMGWYTAVGSIAGAAMVLVSGIVVTFGWKYTFLLYVLAFFELIVVAIYCPVKIQIHSSYQKINGTVSALNGTVVYIWIVFFVYMTFLSTFPPNIALFIQGEGIGNTTICGITSAMFLVSGFVCGLVYEKITSRFKKNTLVLGIAVTALGIVVVSASQSAVAVIAGASVAGFGMGITLPTGNLISASSVVPEKAATAIAIGASGYHLAQFMTTFIVTPLADYFFGTNEIRGRFIVSACALCFWTILVYITTIISNQNK